MLILLAIVFCFSVFLLWLAAKAADLPPALAGALMIVLMIVAFGWIGAAASIAGLLLGVALVIRG